MWEYIAWAGGGFFLGAVITFIFLSIGAGSKMKRARTEADKAKENAQSEAEKLIKEAEIKIKEELFQKRENFEAELEEKKREIKGTERRLSKREDNLDKKLDVVAKKERYLEKQDHKIQNKEKHLKNLEQKAQSMIEEQNKTLQKLSGLGRDEAIKLYLSRLEKEVEHEAATMITRIVDKAKEEATTKARKILATSIQRVSVEHTRETVVSTVDLPNDEMKGRIIGREGRNIRHSWSGSGFLL